MRDVDRVINYIRFCDFLSPIEQQIMINRLESAPSQLELDRARLQVHPSPFSSAILNEHSSGHIVKVGEEPWICVCGEVFPTAAEWSEHSSEMDK